MIEYMPKYVYCVRCTQEEEAKGRKNIQVDEKIEEVENNKDHEE